MFDNEYLEIFGDRKEFEIISDRLQKTFDEVDNSPCKHENIEEFPSNTGYCTDCGLNISDVLKFKTSLISSTLAECSHENKYEDSNGLHICSDCNAELEFFNDEPEWRFYPGADNKSSKDPSRCHTGKSSIKTLSKLFDSLKLSIPQAIKAQVESKYNKIVGTNTVRGKGRRSIIAACLFYTYMEFGECRTTDYIRDMFELTKKDMSSGLTEYCRVFPEARTQYITPKNLLGWILTLTGVGKEHYRKIVQISKYLENSSQLLQRSSPQSVASATVYFYLCLNPKYKEELGLTKSQFAIKALLSDITVNKLVKEASAISKCIINI